MLCVFAGIVIWPIWLDMTKPPWCAKGSRCSILLLFQLNPPVVINLPAIFLSVWAAPWVERSAAFTTWASMSWCDVSRFGASNCPASSHTTQSSATTTRPCCALSLFWVSHNYYCYYNEKCKTKWEKLADFRGKIPTIFVRKEARMRSA